MSDDHYAEKIKAKELDVRAAYRMDDMNISEFYNCVDSFPHFLFYLFANINEFRR